MSLRELSAELRYTTRQRASSTIHRLVVFNPTPQESIRPAAVPCMATSSCPGAKRPAVARDEHEFARYPLRSYRIGLLGGVDDGTIAAKIVTHRSFLLGVILGGGYDEPIFIGPGVAKAEILAK